MQTNIWSEINEYAAEIDNAMFHNKDIFKSQNTRLEAFKNTVSEMRNYNNETSVDDTIEFINRLQVRMREYGIRGMNR